MNIFITLDYEMFFGRTPGTVEKTLIEPTDAIAAIARARGARLSLFVDAGFLIKLEEYSRGSAEVERQRVAVRGQIERLIKEGHEIQLHIHPHWEDSYWSEHSWVIDTRRYRLHDFSLADMRDLVGRYHHALTDMVGGDRVVAFRAGGWVMQPFADIGDALYEVGIRIDSTVFQGGRADSTTHWFDFRNAPDLSCWRFGSDPLVPSPNGRFLEVPIASYRPGPVFFWRMALSRVLGSTEHQGWGDGRAVPLGRKDTLRKLFANSASVVSIDGFKSGFLMAAYDDYRRKGRQEFVVIGHPKLFTRYSLSRLDDFLASSRHERFCGYHDVLSLLGN